MVNVQVRKSMDVMRHKWSMPRKIAGRNGELCNHPEALLEKKKVLGTIIQKHRCIAAATVGECGLMNQ